MEIKDKIVIVTGASSGIGLATAKLLAKEGARVVLAARSSDKLQELEKELPDSLAVPTDMNKDADIKNLVEQTLKKYGRVDVLINNAGHGMYGSVENIKIDDYKEMMDLNVYAIVKAMQGVIPIMRKQGSGLILNISSRVSKNYFPGLGAYASTKYALNAITLTARQELEADKIVVSVFHPKMTDTNFNQNAVGERPYWVPKPGTENQAPEVDTPEQVAIQIIKQIKSEEAEVMM